jgi:hypothetical protein
LIGPNDSKSVPRNREAGPALKTLNQLIFGASARRRTVGRRGRRWKRDQWPAVVETGDSRLRRGKMRQASVIRD